MILGRGKQARVEEAISDVSLAGSRSSSCFDEAERGIFLARSVLSPPPSSQNSPLGIVGGGRMNDRQLA